MRVQKNTRTLFQNQSEPAPPPPPLPSPVHAATAAFTCVNSWVSGAAPLKKKLHAGARSSLSFFPPRGAFLHRVIALNPYPPPLSLPPLSPISFARHTSTCTFTPIVWPVSPPTFRGGAPAPRRTHNKRTYTYAPCSSNTRSLSLSLSPRRGACPWLSPPQRDPLLGGGSAGSLSCPPPPPVRLSPTHADDEDADDDTDAKPCAARMHGSHSPLPPPLSLSLSLSLLSLSPPTSLSPCHRGGSAAPGVTPLTHARRQPPLTRACDALCTHTWRWRHFFFSLCSSKGRFHETRTPFCLLWLLFPRRPLVGLQRRRAAVIPSHHVAAAPAFVS